MFRRPDNGRKELRDRDGSLPLPQLVDVALTHTIEIDLDLKVEVADVSGVWLHAEHPGHLIPLLAGQVVVEVEHCLLPVGFLCIRSSGEAHPLVTLGEGNVKVGDEGVHVIIPLDLQVEGGGEGDVLLSAGLEVNLLDQAF